MTKAAAATVAKGEDGRKKPGTPPNDGVDGGGFPGPVGLSWSRQGTRAPPAATSAPQSSLAHRDSGSGGACQA